METEKSKLVNSNNNTAAVRTTAAAAAATTATTIRGYYLHAFYCVITGVYFVCLKGGFAAFHVSTSRR